MIVSKKAQDLIRKAIKKRYATLALSLLGRDMFSKEELKELEAAGVDTSKDGSLINMIYYHNVLNPHGKKDSPESLEEMKKQQKAKPLPKGRKHTLAEDHMNESLKTALEKIQQDTLTRIAGFIRETNQNFKFNSLEEENAEIDKMLKEFSIQKLKQTIRDKSGDANRDWLRVATTEMSNAIGVGSVDRIAEQNQGKNFEDIYVYRIVVNDAALCAPCRKFYLDRDGSPKVYRLATLLSNGSNYGKKRADWLPVVGATHPNERCSQVIEVKPGWKLLSGGSQTFLGFEKWPEYISKKVIS